MALVFLPLFLAASGSDVQHPVRDSQLNIHAPVDAWSLAGHPALPEPEQLRLPAPMPAVKGWRGPLPRRASGQSLLEQARLPPAPGSQHPAGNHLQMPADLSRAPVGEGPDDPAPPRPVPPEPARPEPVEPPPVPYRQQPPGPRPPHPTPPPWPPPRPWPEPPTPPPEPRPQPQPRPLPPPEPEPEPGPYRSLSRSRGIPGHLPEPSQHPPRLCQRPAGRVRLAR